MESFRVVASRECELPRLSSLKEECRMLVQWPRLVCMVAEALRTQGMPARKTSVRAEH